MNLPNTDLVTAAFEAGRQRGKSEGIIEGGRNSTEVQMAQLDKITALAQIHPLLLRIRKLEEENEELKRQLNERKTIE